MKGQPITDFEVITDAAEVQRVKDATKALWFDRLMEGAMLSFSQRPNFTVVQRSLMAERGVKQRSRSMDGRVYIWFEQA